MNALVGDEIQRRGNNEYEKGRELERVEKLCWWPA